MTTMTREQEKIHSIAEELQKKDYRVVISPTQQDVKTLPFDLGTYTPDLIAFNHEGGCIVEVKLRSHSVSVERFQQIADIVARHQGWRFLMATLDDISEFDLLEAPRYFPDWYILSERLEVIKQLLKDSLLEPASLYVWSLIEVSLRKRAIAVSLPIERWSPMKLIKHLYSLGELSLEEYELLTSLFPVRNKIVHGLVASIRDKDCQALCDVAEEFLKRWSHTDESA